MSAPIDPALVQLFAVLVQFVGPTVLEALTEPAREAVRKQLARDRARLDAAPLAGPPTEAVIARYQARPAPARISADTDLPPVLRTHEGAWSDGESEEG